MNNRALRYQALRDTFISIHGREPNAIELWQMNVRFHQLTGSIRQAKIKRNKNRK